MALKEGQGSHLGAVRLRCVVRLWRCSRTNWGEAWKEYGGTRHSAVDSGVFTSVL